MWIRRVSPLFLGLLAGIFDATVSVWLPGGFAGVCLALPLVVAWTVFSSPARALMAAAAAGIAMDLLLPTTGFVTLRFLGVVGVVFAAARIYFTNRSLMGSFALGVVGFAVDRLLLAIVLFLRGWSAAPFVPEYRPPVLPELAWILFCLGATFFLFAAFTRRFLPSVAGFSRR